MISGELIGVTIPFFVDGRISKSFLSRSAFDRLISDRDNHVAESIRWQSERERLSEEYVELPNGKTVPIWKQLHLPIRFFDRYLYQEYLIIEDDDLAPYDYNGTFGDTEINSSVPFVIYTGYGVIGRNSPLNM